MAGVKAKARPPTAESCDVGYEVRDASPRAVTVAMLGLFVFIAASGAIAAGIVALVRHPVTPSWVTPVETANRTPPPPRLEVRGGEDRALVEAAAAEKLAGYAWVDRAKATARIPIERAMELLVQRGWPDANAGGGNAPKGDAQQGSAKP